MELDRRGAELLFQVLTKREEKNSIAIANESFSGWTKTFTDLRLCAAIVDRLTFNGAIIETGTDAYRLPVRDINNPAGDYFPVAALPVLDQAVSVVLNYVDILSRHPRRAGGTPRRPAGAR